VGQPSAEIVRVAEEVNARFVLLGSPHRSRMERVLLGRTISKVIAESPCDVLLIPESAEIGFGRILVGISGSRASLKAAERALVLSRDYGSQLHGVTAVDVPVESSLRYGVMNEAWQRGIEALDAFTMVAGSRDYPVVTALREARPDKCLLRYAEEQDIQLIVLGSHGHSWVNELFLDTVIERVASNSTCPVLVVNRTAAEA
jgi:nucleotide-binding universal stress UspA family protein